jgi:hypothetical protein
MFQPTKQKIMDIVSRRFIHIDDKFRRTFPSVLLNQQLRWISFADEELFSLIFLSQEDLKRVKHFQARQLNPFPGLITTNPKESYAFRFSGIRLGSISGNSVKNSNSFYIGPDSSFFVVDHTQSLNNVEFGELSYRLPLSYFISFGIEITPDNAYENLDELIVCSIKAWRKSHH